MVMSKYVWASEGYMFEDSDCGIIDAKDDFEAITFALGLEEEEDLHNFVAHCFEIDLEEGEEISDTLKKKIIKQLEDDNGDGQPYFTVKSESGKVIFGG
jgi:hypothetical protein